MPNTETATSEIDNLRARVADLEAAIAAVLARCDNEDAAEAYLGEVGTAILHTSTIRKLLAANGADTERA